MAEDIKTAIEKLDIHPPIVEPDEPFRPEGDRFCGKHGPFPAYFWLGGQRIQATCPECARQAAQAVGIESTRAIAQRNTMAAADRKREAFEKRIGRAMVPKRYRELTLSTFPAARAGGNAAAVVEACRSYVSNWQRYRTTGTGMILVGATGRGKTGLACSIANAVLQQGDTALFITAQSVLTEITSTWGRKGRTELDVMTDFTGVDLLILDDVGAQLGADLEMKKFFGMVDARYANCKPTIMLSNLPLEDQGAIKGLRTFLGQPIWTRMLDDGAQALACQWQTLRGGA